MLMADSLDAVVLKVALMILVKYGKEIRKRKDMESIVHFLTTDIPGLYAYTSEIVVQSFSPFCPRACWFHPQFCTILTAQLVLLPHRASLKFLKTSYLCS